VIAELFAVGTGGDKLDGIISEPTRLAGIKPMSPSGRMRLIIASDEAHQPVVVVIIIQHVFQLGTADAVGDGRGIGPKQTGGYFYRAT
jgi:hypothetical protein